MKLGQYEVGPKIGGGGMATVYVGRNEADDLVAIKVIKDELAKDTEYIHMFLDEAKLLSRLSHDDIIVTRDFGVTDDARFIAMELLLGRSLMDVFDRVKENGTRIPIDLAAWIAMRVAHALAYAHGLEVIHRDVNPTNVFLTYDGRVKLIDFGLAKSVGRLAKSKEGVVKGKVPYLAPEQVDQKPFDHRVDLYALGATLWEMTTGRRLFKRDTDVETLKAIRENEVPDPRTFVEGLYPDTLWDIVRRAVERDPAKRYQDADVLARDLGAFVDKSGRPDMPGVLARFIEELFPGERTKQEAWLASLRSPPEREKRPTTIAPPAPVAEVDALPKPAAAAPASAPDPAPASAGKHPFAALLAVAGTLGFFVLLAVIFRQCGR